MQTLELGGKRFVVLEASEYEKLRSAAGEGPALPRVDANGHVPALEYTRKSMAREVIARRKKAGWTVEQLARKAKVRVDVVRSLEQGESKTSVAAVDRIDRALRAAKA
ncbi:MAG: helix-turn-helix transcriptional regulator [Pirellulaceae bacterium]